MLIDNRELRGQISNILTEYQDAKIGTSFALRLIVWDADLVHSSVIIKVSSICT